MTSSIDRRDFLIASAGAVATPMTSGALRAKSSSTSDLRVVGLSVDYLTNPMGLENRSPRLSWQLNSQLRGIRQSSYRIRVATSVAILASGRGDLWDSGNVSTRESIGIEYSGNALKSRQRCYWQVEVWDERGSYARSDEHTWWEMGLLNPEDWSAEWLAADDDVAQADRGAHLYWLWDATSEGSGAPGAEPAWRFQLQFELSEGIESGTLFIAARNIEHVTDIWMDDAAVGSDIPTENLVGEFIPLDALTAGKHTLTLDLQLKRVAPVSWPGKKIGQNGMAVLARLETRLGRAIRLTSGAGWEVARRQEEVSGDRRPSAVSDTLAWSAAASAPCENPISVEPAMYLRRVFSVEAQVVQARLYITALGAYEGRLNGQRIGDALLTPEVSQYERSTLYQIYDVTDLLQPGENAMGLVVGDGWYASHPGQYSWGPPPRRVLAQLELVMADGSVKTINTGSDWRIARSPILRSQLCIGEVYDARLEQNGWDTPHFEDIHWASARVAERPHCKLVAQVTPPIRATQALKAQSVTNPRPNVYVFDLGQNFAGWARLRVRGPVGTRIDLRFGEELMRSGMIDQLVLLGGKAIDSYILRGDPAGEVFEPRFAYHGFRYVEVRGLPSPPSDDLVEGVAISSDLEHTAFLSTDSPLINRIWQNTLWSQRSNFTGIPTDCPNRAERLGWMVDAGAFWDAASFNMDVAAFTRRQMNNVRDAQHDNGSFASAAPFPQSLDLWGGKSTAAPGGSDAGVSLPWVSWRRYGDLAIIDQNFEAMKRYVQFIADRNPDHLWSVGRGPDFGDWMAIGNNPFYHPERPASTPLDLIATAYWANSAQLLAQMAEATGRAEDATRLYSMSNDVRTKFSETFIKASGEIGNGSQTSYILALKFGLVPESLRQRAAEHLVSDIRQRGVALSTGFLGTQYSLDVLADAGYHDLVFDLLLRKSDPSWGFMIEHGATTMWERWDGDLKRDHNEASHNHGPLGAVCGFIARRLAGVDAACPGFKKTVARPVFDPRVRHVKFAYESVMGRIETTSAFRSSGEWRFQVSIPANTDARLELPARSLKSIRESRRAVVGRRDVRVIEQTDRSITLEVGSGSYDFVITS
jgi:alpha-L-rhamnosidase